MVKKINFKNIGIFATKKNKRVLEMAKQCCEVLVNQGINVSLSDTLSSLAGNKGCKLLSDKNLTKKIDLLIAIGGDGTMLSGSRRYGSQGLPILGINLGTLGFLSDIQPEDISSGLTKVLRGSYSQDRRFFLKAFSNKPKEYNIALNEIVVHSGAVAQLIEYEIYVNKKFVYRQRSDGLIINTPTGSTAYSLSGGGPIVHPNVKAITILPMLPLGLNSSPLLVDEKSNIEIRMIGKKNKAKISFDSHDTTKALAYKESLFISRAEENVTLIHPKGHDFYSACRNKLGWGSSINPNNQQEV